MNKLEEYRESYFNNLVKEAFGDEPPKKLFDKENSLLYDFLKKGFDAAKNSTLHAKLITPTPVMYTEEEVLKAFDEYDEYCWKDTFGDMKKPEEEPENPHITGRRWWNENKKK